MTCNVTPTDDNGIPPSIIKLSTKDGNKVCMSNHGYSHLHPVHVGQSFSHDGKVHRSMIGAIKAKESQVKGDKASELMAMEFTHIPSRLKSMQVCSFNPDSESEWHSIRKTVTEEIVEQYLESNPLAVAELLSTIGTTVVVKGIWEPETANISMKDIQAMTGLESLQGRNFIGQFMTDERAKYLKYDQEKRPNSHYEIEKSSEFEEVDSISGLPGTAIVFSVKFLPSLISVDPIMLKRILSSLVDTFLAQLHQRSSVKLSFGCGNKTAVQEYGNPADIARPALARLLIDLCSVQKIVKNGLSVHALQFLDRDATRKHPAIKTDPQPKKIKGKSSAGASSRK